MFPPLRALRLRVRGQVKRLVYGASASRRHVNVLVRGPTSEMLNHLLMQDLINKVSVRLLLIPIPCHGTRSVQQFRDTIDPHDLRQDRSITFRGLIEGLVYGLLMSGDRVLLASRGFFAHLDPMTRRPTGRLPISTVNTRCHRA